tara:strand:+ start:325 stop:519 length:195 start_codon:yes stop_codon:yes gene_type:complete|eukprot:scaffold67606_cov67-Phaeocystis_antarctica.AAC.5
MVRATACTTATANLQLRSRRRAAAPRVSACIATHARLAEESKATAACRLATVSMAMAEPMPLES